MTQLWYCQNLGFFSCFCGTRSLFSQRAVGWERGSLTEEGRSYKRGKTLTKKVLWAGSREHWSVSSQVAAAAAKSLQSCLTLCDLIDGSPPGSTVPGILQARTLKWVAISFSKAWKWKVKVKSLSLIHLLATPRTAAYQAPLSMGFSRQEYWSGLPVPSPAARLSKCLIQEWIFLVVQMVRNLPGMQETGLIPGLGRSPGEGNSYPLQCSCLGNPMDRGAWWITVCGVAKSWTWQSNDSGIASWAEAWLSAHISVRKSFQKSAVNYSLL